IFQYGGLSQLDSWDPKPDGPSEVRGPYKAIPTPVPGLRVGELMPRLARLADRYAVLRSLSHRVGVHDVANRMLLAGPPSPPPMRRRASASAPSTCSPHRRPPRRSTATRSRPGCATAPADTRSDRTCCWRGD